MSRDANPAEAVNETSVAERVRVPLSLPVARLSVPEIPGYHLHWFRGTPQRMQRALQGGYEMVKDAEVILNSRILGSDTAESGNTSLGTLVSIPAGDDVSPDGQPVQMILMKIKEEWWLEDQKALVAPGSRIENVRKALLGGLAGADKDAPGDTAQRYVDRAKTKVPEFLKRKG